MIDPPPGSPESSESSESAPSPPSPAALGSGLPRGARQLVAAVVIFAIVLIGMIGYAAASLSYASNRIAGVDRTLNVVISHQNTLNTTFQEIDTKFTGLSSTSSFDPVQARSVVDQFVASAKSAGATVDQDDASLVTARASLHDQPWLAFIGRGGLDKEAARVDHARKALNSARMVAGDYALDGQFLQAFLDTVADLDMLGTQSAAADLTGAQATLARMKGHADTALQQSTGPGLPPELHDLMADFETLIADFGKLLSAVAANDDVALSAAEASLQADANKLSGYDFTKIGTEIAAYYKPMVDAFNSEMAKATS